MIRLSLSEICTLIDVLLTILIMETNTHNVWEKIVLNALWHDKYITGNSEC